jgi:2-polyprenyl-3-methyl-5-hydroxy-6-metoxy-1,4-benzoquinol methylase
MEQLKQCPICAHSNSILFLEVKDHSISKENFHIEECLNCGFKYTNPRPGENSIGKYYASTDYISHSNTKKGLVNFLYHQVRKFTLSRKLNLINALSPKGHMLDIGCGTGKFLEVCQAEDWKIDGMEPDESAREIAETTIGKPLYKDIFSISGKGKYQIITLWHVLEHIHQLNESISHIADLLDSNGTLIIAVPNSNSYDAKKYKDHWAAYDVPRHLYHFENKTMEALLKKHHLKIIKMQPMKFDAFYVSMLSEKYKTFKSINFLKSMFTGLVSNWKAGKDNYSSMIYIAKKE